MIKRLIPIISLILASLFIIPSTLVLAGTSVTVSSGNATMVLVMPDKPPEVEKKGSPEIDASKLKVGDKVVTGTNSFVVYLGNDYDSKGKLVNKFTTNIGGPQYLEDLTTRIDPTWHYVSPMVWKSGANLFFAGVAGEWVEVIYNDQKYLWKSDLLIGTKEYKAKSIEPILLDQDPLNQNYHGNTLQWDYGIATRNIRIIEGVISEYFIFDKDPKADIKIVTAQTKDTGFIWEKPPWAMDANNNRIPVTIDRLVKAEDLAKAVYPIYIDPTTTFTTSASDGWFLETDAVYNTVWTKASGTPDASGIEIGIGQEFFLGAYGVYRGFTYFDTSSIPDSSTATAGTLKLYGSGSGLADNYILQIQNGMPTYPHDPLAAGDFSKANYSGSGGTFDTTGFSTSAYNNVSLNAAGLTWVNKSGWTKFTLRSGKDVNGNVPTQREFLKMWSYEKGTGYWPLLEVTYTAYAAPSVTQQAVSDIATTSAIAHGTITDDGGDPNSWANFWWGTTSGGPYTSNSTRTYGLSTGSTFQATMGSLIGGTTYYVIATAGNTVGSTNTSQVSFTTSSSLNPPTGLSAIPRSGTEISLKWVKGVGADRTVIVYQTGSYPATYTSGLTAYNGTASSVSLPGLTVGTTYYFKAWGWSNGFSTANLTEMGTTWAVGSTGNTPEGPSAPTDFWRAINYSSMSNLPIYGVMNAAADSFPMPRETMWFLFAIGVSVILAVTAFVIFRIPWAALGGAGVGIGWGWNAQIVPGWFLAVCIVMAVIIIMLTSGDGK